MRLIDADLLTKEVNDYIGSHMLNLVTTTQIIMEIIKDIDIQPTAYDIDKVVKKLEEVEFETQEEPHVLNLYSAIEIVKGGGVE